MRRPFTILAIIALLGLAATQAIRLGLGFPMTYDSWPVPPAISIFLLVAALVLALGLIWELWSGQGGTSPAATRGGGGGSGSGSGRTRSVAPGPGGFRKPVEYFAYASNNISPSAIKKAAEKYDRFMIGFDSGSLLNGSAAASFKAAKDAGAELEIYVEGPGGVTGSSGWAADEKARVRAAAKKVGVDVNNKNWMKEWDAWAWKDYTLMQLEEYHRDGFSAGEIDNLHRVLGDHGDSHIEFFKEYAEIHAQGRLPLLVLKNQDEEQLEALVKEIKAGRIPRAMFAEFHIAEVGGGSLGRRDKISSTVGIRTLASRDTYNYDAKGEFGLEQQLMAALDLAPNPKPSAPTPHPADPGRDPDAAARHCTATSADTCTAGRRVTGCPGSGTATSALAGSFTCNCRTCRNSPDHRKRPCRHGQRRRSGRRRAHDYQAGPRGPASRLLDTAHGMTSLDPLNAARRGSIRAIAPG